MGVAYSKSGRLEGPWIQEKEPLTPPNHGHQPCFLLFRFVLWNNLEVVSKNQLTVNMIRKLLPLTPPNHGHGMIFKDLEGRNILSAHSHSEINGRYVRRPVFWEIDLTGDKLRIIRKID